MGRPLRAKYSGSVAIGVQEMSDSDLADLIGPLLINYLLTYPQIIFGTRLRLASSLNDVSRGSVTDTRVGSVGTHPASATVINTYTFYQNEKTQTPNPSARPVHYVQNGSEYQIKSMTNQEIYDYLLPSIINTMLTGGRGAYYLGKTTDGAPATGTWTAYGTLNDTYYDTSNVLTTVGYTLWQRTDAATLGTIRPLRYLQYGTGAAAVHHLDEMTDSDIEGLATHIGEYIRTKGIGQYSVGTTAPGTGTWQSRGSFTDTVNNLQDTAYAGTYIGYFTGGYTGSYSGLYTGAYSAVYVGNYNTAYTGNYQGFYSGIYSGLYTGAFTGAYNTTYTGLYTGAYAQSFTGAYSKAYTSSYLLVNYTAGYVISSTALFTGAYAGTYTGAINPAIVSAPYVSPVTYYQTSVYTNSVGNNFTGQSEKYVAASYTGPGTHVFQNASYYTGAYTDYGQTLFYNGRSALITYAGYYTGNFTGAHPGTVYNGAEQPITSWSRTIKATSYTGILRYYSAQQNPVYTRSFVGQYTTGTGIYYNGRQGTVTYTGTYTVAWTGSWTRETFTSNYTQGIVGVDIGFYSSLYTSTYLNDLTGARRESGAWSGAYVLSLPATEVRSYTRTYVFQYTDPNKGGAYYNGRRQYPITFTNAYTGTYSSSVSGKLYVGTYSGNYTGPVYYNGRTVNPNTVLYVGYYTGQYVEGILVENRRYNVYTGIKPGLVNDTPTQSYGGALTYYSGGANPQYSSSYTVVWTGPVYYNGRVVANAAGYASTYTVTWTGTWTNQYFTNNFTRGPSNQGTIYTGLYAAAGGGFTGSFAGGYTRIYSGIRSVNFTGNVHDNLSPSAFYSGSYSAAYTSVWTGAFTGQYAGGYTKAYAGSYSQAFGGSYAGTYAGTYAGAYTRAYTGNWTGIYAGSYIGAYVGEYGGAFSRVFTGAYSGLTVLNTSSTTTYTLWVRTA